MKRLPTADLKCKNPDQVQSNEPKQQLGGLNEVSSSRSLLDGYQVNIDCFTTIQLN
jgi:hypothetical protein